MTSRLRRNSLHEVETSPDGRYIRFDEKLGSGAYKDVYLCYDTETGQEVAWNTVYFAGLPPSEQIRIRGETAILRTLNHPHVMGFHDVWENYEKQEICFTTEIVTSGTLKQYINRVKGIKLKVIKSWCRQILDALKYLHSLNPPIIHRDLKCDNIFIHGANSSIRLGDFGLARARHHTHVTSVLGTPEFMAPELYEMSYSEGVDIYAFGMCVLEMVTKEYPYEECTNAAQIWKRVSNGRKPEVLQRIKHSDVRAFIEICLETPDLRPSAAELLEHPFLAFEKSNPYQDDIVVHVNDKPESETNPNGLHPVEPYHEHHDVLYNPSPHSHTPIPPNVPLHPVQKPPQLAGKFVDSPHKLTSNAPITASSPRGPITPVPIPPSSQPQLQSVVSPVQRDRERYHINVPQTPPPSGTPVSAPSQPTVLPPQPSGTTVQSARLHRPPSFPNIPSIPHLHEHAPSTPTHDRPTGGTGTPIVSAAATQISVEVEGVQQNIAHVVLHIHFEGRRKKQIRFDFDFRADTYAWVSGEMVRALKLPDSERTQHLVASYLEAKLEPIKRAYIRGVSTHQQPGGGTLPTHHSGQTSVAGAGAGASSGTGVATPAGTGTGTSLASHHRAHSITPSQSTQQLHSVHHLQPTTSAMPAHISPPPQLPPPSHSQSLQSQSLAQSLPVSTPQQAEPSSSQPSPAVRTQSPSAALHSSTSAVSLLSVVPSTTSPRQLPPTQASTAAGTRTDSSTSTSTFPTSTPIHGPTGTLTVSTSDASPTGRGMASSRSTPHFPSVNTTTTTPSQPSQSSHPLPQQQAANTAMSQSSTVAPDSSTSLPVNINASHTTGCTSTFVHATPTPITAVYSEKVKPILDKSSSMPITATSTSAIPSATTFTSSSISPLSVRDTTSLSSQPSQDTFSTSRFQTGRRSNTFPDGIPPSILQEVHEQQQLQNSNSNSNPNANANANINLNTTTTSTPLHSIPSTPTIPAVLNPRIIELQREGTFEKKLHEQTSNANNNNGNLRRSSSAHTLPSIIENHGNTNTTSNLNSEEAKQMLHDRLYDYYKTMSVSELKQRLKEKGGNEKFIKGCFEKRELIEQLIVLTPMTEEEPRIQRPPSLKLTHSPQSSTSTSTTPASSEEIKHTRTDSKDPFSTLFSIPAELQSHSTGSPISSTTSPSYAVHNAARTHTFYVTTPGSNSGSTTSSPVASSNTVTTTYQLTHPSTPISPSAVITTTTTTRPISSSHATTTTRSHHSPPSAAELKQSPRSAAAEAAALGASVSLARTQVAKAPYSPSQSSSTISSASSVISSTASTRTNSPIPSDSTLSALLTNPQMVALHVDLSSKLDDSTPNSPGIKMIGVHGSTPTYEGWTLTPSASELPDKTYDSTKVSSNRSNSMPNVLDIVPTPTPLVNAPTSLSTSAISSLAFNTPKSTKQSIDSDPLIKPLEEKWINELMSSPSNRKREV